MSTIQQLVDQLGAGWKIIDGVPKEETTVVTVQDPNGIKPATSVNRGSGRYYVVVQDAQGTQRALFLSPQPVKGGLVVKQTGVNDTVPDTDADPSGRLGKTKPNPNIYNGPLDKIDWGSGGPIGDVPNKPNQPSATGKLDKIDAQGNVIPEGSTTKPVKLRDPATGTVVDLPQDPNGVVTPVGNNFFVIKPDGSSTLVTGKDGQPLTKQSEAQALNVPGVGVVAFDPLHPENTKVALAAQTNVTAASLGAQAIREVNGVTYVAKDDGKGGIEWQETNLPANHKYSVAAGGNDANSKYITLIDDQGNSLAVEKAGWTKPPGAQAGSALTPSLDAPYVVTIGDDNKPVFTPNQNKLSITDAQAQLINTLGLKVAQGSMTEKEAMDLIASQTQAMTAQANKQNAAANMLTAQTGQQRLGVDAAQQALTGVNNAAQVGAGMLQNRVTAATGALNTVVGQLGSGNLVAGGLPSGWGANLTGGLQDWVTSLGGGQGTYDAAAEMVKQANPAISQNPTVAAQAYQALRGYMDLYKAQTGQDWQPGQSTGSSVPGQASSTFNSPVTTQTTQGIDQQLQAQQQAAAQAQVAAGNQAMGSTAALNRQGLLDTPQGRAMAAGQTPVATVPPVGPGQWNTAYQQGVVSPVGKVAPPGSTIVGSGVAPSPMIPGVYSPYGPWQAPVTV